MTIGNQHIRRLGPLVAGIAATGLLLGACSSTPDDDVTIGFITKQQENPFWVTMQDVAEQTAEREGVELLTASGTSDVDVAGQEKAIRDMIEQKVDGIVIAPNSSEALNPAIEDARAEGIIVVAVDTPVEPVDAVDAYYATNNFAAGQLIGEYAGAKIKELGAQPQVVTLNLAPGISSGLERHDGFLEGFGLNPEAPDGVLAKDTEGDREKGEAAMTEVLTELPEVNVVYTVNERAAMGAVDALKASQADLDRVVIVSVDGGCAAMKSSVRNGDIDATAQQFPQNMARESVRAIAEAARGGEKPSGYIDTGLELITDDPMRGVGSKDVAFGVRNCWG